ncbi:MAG: tRNA lysidine(34) synthetase TilS [Candidatus Ornithospirochaeta sp.]
MKSSKRQTPFTLNLPPDDKFVIAFSGGMDSLALIAFMSEKERERSAAVYVDHGIRSRDELDKEIILNKKNARKLGIPFYVIKLGEGAVSRYALEKDCGIEAAARSLRYSQLENFRKENGYDWILTAHHQDDQTETLIMRMMSSSPFWSYGGIREIEGNIRRPLLSLEKKDIRKKVRESGLKWSEDSTNSDENYKRNWIRKNILPSVTLKEKRLISSIASNVAAFPSKEVAVTVYGSYRVTISTDSLLSSYPWDREKAIFMALSKVGNTERIKRGLVSEIIKGAERKSGRTEIGNIVVRYFKDRIEFFAIPSSFISPYRGNDTILPLGLKISDSSQDPLSLRIPQSALKSAVFRKSNDNDEIQLKDGVRKVTSLLKEYHLPYAIVLENSGIVEDVFLSFLGGRDRLSSFLLGKDGSIVTVTY